MLLLGLILSRLRSAQQMYFIATYINSGSVNGD